MKKRKINWDDVKQIIEFKTFYLIGVLFLIGVISLFVSKIPKYYDSFFKDIFFSLGITLITSSIVSILQEFYMRVDIVDFMTQRMLSVMPKKFTGNIGVTEFQLDRKGIDFKQFWREAKGNIKIIGISCNDVLASPNIPLIKQWIEENAAGNIQILLISPWSVTSDIRSKARVYKTKYDGISKIHSVIRDMEGMKESIEDDVQKNRIQVRLYDDIPSLSMIIDERGAVVAPFMVIEIGGSSPYYYVANDKIIQDSLYKRYCMHFDAIWENAVEILDGNDIDRVYQEQREKDKMMVNEIPDTYESWILSVNFAGKGTKNAANKP